jgi:ADP-ribose pyrophosphatase
MDKPEGARLGWKLRGTDYLYEGKTLKLRRDALDLPKKKDFAYEYLERAEAVIIVPVTPAGEIVLIRQYRYPVDAWCLETPAGGCHDTGDASLEEVVRKELHEEIGAEVETVEEVGSFYAAPAFADERCHVFIAWGAKLIERPDRESTEKIETELVPAREAIRRARSGEVATAPCALALWWCEERLKARGFV